MTSSVLGLFGITDEAAYCIACTQGKKPLPPELLQGIKPQPLRGAAPSPVQLQQPQHPVQQPSSSAAPQIAGQAQWQQGLAAGRPASMPAPSSAPSPAPQVRDSFLPLSHHPCVVNRDV